MSHSGVLVDRTSGVVTLTLQRPERRNALNGPMWSAIGEEARKLHADPPRAVIVTGAEGHFCSGMDLKPDNPIVARLAPRAASDDLSGFRSLIVELKGELEALSTIPCPVVAAIEGACAGSGLELALACDLRVAAQDAFFSLPEARAGMMPDVGGTVRLSRVVGRSRAMELILTNGRVDAPTAHAWGLVNRLASKGGALDAARAFVTELMSSGPTATREILALLRRPGATFEEETEAGARVLASGEVHEGLAAFSGKRAPKWSMG
jgi:enoyl-CoA hydratase